MRAARAFSKPETVPVLKSVRLLRPNCSSRGMTPAFGPALSLWMCLENGYSGVKETRPINEWVGSGSFGLRNASFKANGIQSRS
jgi:hypothetical protein